MPASKQQESPFLRLPPELRLLIYSHLITLPTQYDHSPTHNPLIVISDTRNPFTTRGRYRAKHMSPQWDGENKNTVRPLLLINRQIHAEVEDFLYSRHTLFFLNSFNLDHLPAFLDMLSPTARRHIRSVGFEIFLFVHAASGVPKRTLSQYERAARTLREKLPRWEGVVFYLDPWFLLPSCSAPAVAGLGGGDDRDVLARGVGYLAGVFGRYTDEMDFLPMTMGMRGLKQGVSEAIPSRLTLKDRKDQERTERARVRHWTGPIQLQRGLAAEAQAAG